jgi:LPXTG-site transpeptidase (sortase) family protein
MKKLLPTLSKTMLVVGGLMIVIGLGWGLWTRVNAPPPPTITDQGAVVLAVTAPSQAATATPAPSTLPATDTPAIPPTPTQPPSTEGPTPDLLPDWTSVSELSTSTPAPTKALPTPLPPTPSPTPSPTPIPPAEDPPTRIVAPAIELDATVVPMGWELVDHDGSMVSEWVVPSNAAGWHMNSALPGHPGNTVLSGHHNIEGKVFRYVVDLNPGDKVTLYVGDTPYSYTVSEKYILKEAGMPLKVRQKNAQWIMPTEDERLTLVTCWPYEWPGNSHRVIVVARPTGYVPIVEGSR